MINSDLPATRPDAPRPEFCDSAGTRDWLKSLPLTNVQAVQSELSQQLERLTHYPLPALERLKILELLR